MAARGTMSTTSASNVVAAEDDGLGAYRPTVVLLWPDRKTLETGRGAARLGRSVGSDVKVLCGSGVSGTGPQRADRWRTGQ